jgi:hypothetical protein
VNCLAPSPTASLHARDYPGTDTAGRGPRDRCRAVTTLNRSRHRCVPPRAAERCGGAVRVARRRISSFAVLGTSPLGDTAAHARTPEPDDASPSPWEASSRPGRAASCALRLTAAVLPVPRRLSRLEGCVGRGAPPAKSGGTVASGATRPRASRNGESRPCRCAAPARSAVHSPPRSWSSLRAGCPTARRTMSRKRRPRSACGHGAGTFTTVLLAAFAIHMSLPE